MAQKRLTNYLRTYRRRAGLFQNEIALLLGVSSGTKVSRHENFTRQPSVASIFAYEIIFGQPARELFAGTHDDIRRGVRLRAQRLLKSLAQKPNDSRTSAKIKFLQAIVENKPTNTRDAA